MRICCSRPDRLKILDRWLECWRKGDFCDLKLVSSEGESIEVHRLALALASDPLSAMLKGGFAEGGKDSIALSFSTVALRAVVQFIYEGEVQIQPALVPELLKFAQMYDMESLHDEITSALPEQMDAYLCSSLLAEYFALQSKDLQKACKRFAIANFQACCSTDAFKLWHTALLLDILESDLVVSREEEVLLAVLNWYVADATARKEALQVILRGVCFPALASATLAALQQCVPSLGVLGSVLEGYVDQGISKHTKGNMADVCTVPRRSSYQNRWWVDIGCSSRGGHTLKIDESASMNLAEGTLTSFQFCMNGCFISDREKRCIFRLDMETQALVRVAGHGAAVNGVNEFSEWIRMDVDQTGQIFVADSLNTRVLKFSNGHGSVIAAQPQLQGNLRGITVRADGAVFVIDQRGARVQKISETGVEVIAGGNGPGSGANQFRNAHYLFAMADGTIFVSDMDNHRVQKWTAGATEGITVAGGHGPGAEDNQLNECWGIHVTEDETVYVADGKNYRIMKWHKGQKAGLLAAGGHGNGTESHQLSGATDVVLDQAGALYVLDTGNKASNKRVTKWSAAPSTQFEAFLHSF